MSRIKKIKFSIKKTTLCGGRGLYIVVEKMFNCLLIMLIKKYNLCINLHNYRRIAEGSGVLFH